jgi:hypothetical protein
VALNNEVFAYLRPLIIARQKINLKKLAQKQNEDSKLHNTPESLEKLVGELKAMQAGTV